MFNLEAAIAAWRKRLQHNRAFSAEDIEELECHLRDHVEALAEGEMTEELAFRASVRRLGDVGRIETEYRKMYWRKARHRGAIWHAIIWEILMFKNYLKTALRGLRKHKGTSLINISGLAIGMACCIVILYYVREEVSYDTYHENTETLYRLSMESKSLNTNTGGPNATTSILWGPTMLKDYPEVANYTRFVRETNVNDPWEFTFGETSHREAQILFAEPSMFDLFSWKLVNGNPETALAEPSSIVITEEMAEKYFGEENPVGQTLTIDPRQRDQEGNLTRQTYDFEVTGVIQNIPRNSHFTFDFLISFTYLNQIYGGDVTSGDGMQVWFWRGRIAHTYLLLQPGTDPATLEAKFPDFLTRYPIDSETRPRGITTSPSSNPSATSTSMAILAHSLRRSATRPSSTCSRSSPSSSSSSPASTS